MRPLDVAIVGCGTAGPAAALLLARQGHRVTLYERVPNPRPVGAGIILQPTGQAVLARLGLLERILARGERLDRLRVLQPDRSLLLELRYDEVDPRLFGVGLHRGALFEALFEAVRVEPGVELRLGVSVSRLQRLAGGRFAIVDGAGAAHGAHQLVVVADGARSRLRDRAGLVRRAEPYPWGALWFMAEDRARTVESELLQAVDGTHTLVGLLPTGRGPAEDDVPRVSFFYSLRADRLEAFRKRGLAPLKEQVLAMLPEAEPVLAQITEPEQLLFSEYHDVVLAPFHTSAVVHLGDAAHAMSPQLGQGANLALWDALVLAEALADEPRDLVCALASYSRLRRGHLGYYQLVTRLLTPFFQSDHEALGLLRDWFMPLSARLSLVRRAMLMGMCGAADGHPWKWVPGVLDERG